MSLVPTMLKRLVDAGAPVEQYPRAAARRRTHTGRRAHRATAAGATVVDAYGMSETWGGVVLDGVAIDGVEAVLAPDAQILVRGDAVMRGYRLAPAEHRGRVHGAPVAR